MSTATPPVTPTPPTPPTGGIGAWITANKVVLFGIVSAGILAVQQLASQYPKDYKVLGLAAFIAVLSFLANNLRGQWGSILGSLLPSLGIVLANIEAVPPVPISWWQFAGAVALAIGGVLAPPAKSLSYETSPTILAAKAQGAQSDTAQNKSVPVTTK
jgi:hypothetical protein